jgi:hypothetical protein
VQFDVAAPGLLRPAPGSRYFGYWKMANDNFGYHREQAASLVNFALDDARGWMRAGIPLAWGWFVCTTSSAVPRLCSVM